MENNRLEFSKADVLHYKELIADRFVDNPRMSLLFDKSRKNFKKNVFNLVDYCFQIALNINGIYIAKNRKTIVLFYQHKKFKRTLADYLRYFRIIRTIPFFNFRKILANENEIKKRKLKLDNYIYVWFIAQERGYGKLDGLNEINKMLLNLSHISQLPILFETSDVRLINFYKHVGFDIYDKFTLSEETIYFFADKETLKKYKIIV